MQDVRVRAMRVNGLAFPLLFPVFRREHEGIDQHRQGNVCHHGQVQGGHVVSAGQALGKGIEAGQQVAKIRVICEHCAATALFPGTERAE